MMNNRSKSNGVSNDVRNEKNETGESSNEENDNEMNFLDNEAENLDQTSEFINDEVSEIDVDLEGLSLSENRCSNCKREQHEYYHQKYGNNSTYHLVFTTKT
jgi:hypothetical protein